MEEKKEVMVAKLLPRWAVERLQEAAKRHGGFERVRAIDAAVADIRKRLPGAFRNGY